MKRVLIIGLLWILLATAACGPAAQPVPSGDLTTMLTDAKTALDARNPDAAIAILQQALKTNANSTEAHFLLGNAYAQKGMFSQAESEYLAVLRLNGLVSVKRSKGYAWYAANMERLREVFACLQGRADEPDLEEEGQ